MVTFDHHRAKAAEGSTAKIELVNLIRRKEMSRVISAKEARKILGRDAEKLDDYQIENVIDTLSLIAREMLEKASSGELLKSIRQITQILIVAIKPAAEACGFACIIHTTATLQHLSCSSVIIHSHKRLVFWASSARVN